MEPEENSDDENYEPTAKKIKSEWSKQYSNKAMQMMQKMGWKMEDHKGLGKKNQGMLEPIIATAQEGRSGLGHKLDELTEQWDPAREDITLPEKVEFIENKEPFNLTIEDLKDWIRTDKKKLTIDDEELFCDGNILNQILDSKSVFDDFNDNDLRKSRSRANPFETIRNSIFLNRAAVKMANIDAMCDFMFSDPKDKDGSSAVKNNDLLYFADICAGPGGFSEYILYRKCWEAKGFGFTLRGANDFKLDKFFAGSPESFDPYYGVNDDGDVFDEGNQDSLAEYIFRHCDEGVHFVMADGGFSVEGQENIQEILSKQLYLCQCLTALKILRPNGNFVCKLFDIFTPFSVGLIYLMYKSFQEIAIIKPNSSRPANSERYLVCKWKHADTDVVCIYLNYINKLLNEGDTDENDVREIVDIDIIREDNEFFNYITESNNTIGRNQIIGLQKIAAFCKNPQLKEVRQMEFRKRCLELWKLPDKLRQPPENKSVEGLLENILGNWYEEKSTMLNCRAHELSSVESLQKYVESVHDWWFVPIGRGETSLNTCSIFLCRSKGNLLRYTDNKKWEPVDHIFEISAKSLFYGEICYEYSGEGRTQTRVSGLHIIDAIMLGGIDIRRKKLSERMQMCQKYALSVNKPFKENKCPPIRSKPMYKLVDLEKFFDTMRLYTLKDGSSRLGFVLDTDNRFFVPGGIMLFCEIFQDFYSVMSKSRGILYYFNKPKKMSYYEDCLPNEVRNALFASFRNSFMRRLVWKWCSTMQVKENSEKADKSLLYRDDFQKFVVCKSVDLKQH